MNNNKNNKKFKDKMNNYNKTKPRKKIKKK